MSSGPEEPFHEDVTLEEQDLVLEDELGDVEFADNPEPRSPVLIEYHRPVRYLYPIPW